MGTLGIPEMMFIFVLALLLFGPKELPKLGRTVGKALAEFRRAQSELKATFDREMRNLRARKSVSGFQKVWVEILCAMRQAGHHSHDQ